MKPNITRRDALAAIVGAVVGALVALLAGARWRLVAPAGSAPIVYQLDRWTGRAWYLAGEKRHAVADPERR